MYRIVTSAIVTAALCSSASLSANEYVLSKVAKPLSQAINFNLDPKLDSFSGSTQIQIEVLSPTHIIDINGVAYTVSNIKLDGAFQCDMNANMLDTGIVKLKCDDEIAPGKYTLSMDFAAPYNRQSVGLYKTIDADLPYLFTQFEMSDARRAFPVFDEPEYKIPFQVTITAPSDEKVYSNTPEMETVVKGELTRHTFAQTKPIPSYLVAFAVGQFEELEVTGMKIPGRVITTKGKIELAKYAAEQMPIVLGALEEYFGVDYPYAKLDSVAVPEFPFGAMENAGLVTYREDILLLDDSNATQNARQRTVSIVAHELAHQWYGNLVTMKWWNDLWLNEAFASWMASKITHQTHPEFESNLRLSKNRVMDVDARLSTKPIRKPIKTEADIMDGLGLAYSKGESVLSMVENWIGEEAFKSGIRNYIKAHAYKNTTADDLWNALAKASGKNVAKVLKTFIEQSSYPLISVDVSGNKLTLNQQRFVSAATKAPAQTWTVPVSVKFGDSHQVSEQTLLLDAPSKTFELPFAPKWVFPDAQGMGYYRWLLTADQMAILLSNSKTALTPKERKALISAADALLEAGYISGGDLFNILGEFINDKHPQIVSDALGYLQAQKGTFVDDSNRELWAKFVTQKARNALDSYGLTTKSGEDAQISKLRPLLIALLGFEGHDVNIIATAKAQTLRYLDTPIEVDPYLISTYLQLAVFHGDAALLKKVKQVFETTKDPQQRTNLLYALGYASEGKLQQDILAYSLSEKLTAPDLSYLFAGQHYTKARQTAFSNWVYANYAALADKLPPFALPRLPGFLVGSCDLESLARANAFFSTKIDTVPGYARSLSKLEERVRDCVQLKAREQASVDRFLKNH
ncbi:M1 family metallopeptidase [Shewanella psychrotolerans]|uniref:M1 family metallopeptidase n=1 Tax=Shewanella psychrotolerans TaxID=2864206 RepID=UPI001C654D9F|nr:M1 family metallopeptidase [Shewanella psychrotolerans]QYJ99766.1 M1 family metallopeptidase [Shewanella psychrotolerans]